MKKINLSFLLIIVIALTSCTTGSKPTAAIIPIDNQFALSDDQKTLVVYPASRKVRVASLQEIIKIDDLDYDGVTIYTQMDRLYNDGFEIAEKERNLFTFGNLQLSIYKTNDGTILNTYNLTDPIANTKDYFLADGDIEAFSRDGEVFITYPIHLKKHPENDVIKNYEKETRWSAINVESLETTLYSKNPSEYIWDVFYSRTNFHQVNNIDFTLGNRAIDNLTQIEVFTNDLPANNTILYSMFPGLQLNRYLALSQNTTKDESTYMDGTNSIRIYTESFTTPDLVFSLLSEQGTSLNWDDVYIDEKYTENGLPHKINSYEDYLNYFQNQEEPS